MVLIASVPDLCLSEAFTFHVILNKTVLII